MKDSISKPVKSGFLYFLFIQLIVLTSLLLSLVFIVPIRMMFPDPGARSICECATAMLTECIVTIILFSAYQRSEKVTFGAFILPCAIAYPLHFLLSLLNGFYVYTAGSASGLSDLMWSLSTKEDVAHADVPTSCNIAAFFITLILKFACLLLCFWLVARRRKKELREIRK